MDHSLFTYLYSSTNQHLCCHTKRLCFHGHHDSANWRSNQLNQSWRGFPAQKHILGQIQVKTSIALIIVTSLDFMFGFFETDIHRRSSLCDLRKFFGPRQVLDPWISPTSVPIGLYPYDIISVHSSSRGLLNFHTVLSSNSPTYTVLPSGVTVIS